MNRQPTTTPIPKSVLHRLSSAQARLCAGDYHWRHFHKFLIHRFSSAHARRSAGALHWTYFLLPRTLRGRWSPRAWSTSTTGVLKKLRRRYSPALARLSAGALHWSHFILPRTPRGRWSPRAWSTSTTDSRGHKVVASLACGNQRCSVFDQRS